jgi:hypothetical protein
MSPALGSRVRPEASRQSPRRVSCIRTQTPARRQGRKAGETGCEGGKAVGRMRHWQPGPPAVEDGMDHCAHVGCARLATGFGHGHERGPDGPCHLSELGGIALPPPVPSARQVFRGATLYHADHFADSLSACRPLWGGSGRWTSTDTRLVPQCPNPDIRGLSMSDTTLHHIIRWNVEKGCLLERRRGHCRAGTPFNLQRLQDEGKLIHSVAGQTLQVQIL